MSKVARVRLQENSRILSFYVQELDLSIGEEVIVEGERGEEFGKVISRQELTHKEGGREKLPCSCPMKGRVKKV